MTRQHGGLHHPLRGKDADEIFAAGTIFITDNDANAIYMQSQAYFPSNEVYTLANVVGDVGLVDLSSGVVTPVVTGFQVHGLAFAPTRVGIVP